MNKNQIVYSKDKGFGITVGSGDSAGVPVIFGDSNSPYTVNEWTLELPNSALVSYVMNKSPYSYSYQTQKKGNEYVAENKVESVGVDGEKITGRVKGSYENVYTVTISKGDTYNAHRCTCPVGTRCKHCFAVLTELKNRLTALKEGADEYAMGFGISAEGDYPLSADMISALDYIVRQREATAETALAVIREIEKDETAECLAASIQRIYKLAPKTKAPGIIRGLFDFLALSDTVHRVMEEFLKNCDDEKITGMIRNSFLKVENLLNKNPNPRTTYTEALMDWLYFKEFYFLYNRRNDELINSMLAFQYGERDENLVDSECFMLLEMDKARPLSDECKDRIFSSIADGDVPYELHTELGKLLDEDKFKQLADTGMYRGELPQGYENKLNFEAVVSYLNGIVCFDESAKRILNRIIELGKGRERETATVLDRLVHSFSSEYVKEYVSELASQLPHSEVLTSYLKSGTARNRSYIYCHVGEEGGSIGFTQNMWDYFDAKYSVNLAPNEKSYSIMYKLISPAGRSILSFNDNNDGYGKGIESCFDYDLFESIAREVKYHIMHTDRENLMRDIESAKNQIELAEEKRKNAALERRISETAKRMSGTGISLSIAHKASLEFEFGYDDRYISMAMKIGCEKKYVVKDVYSLVRSFSAETTESYGKKFEFTHKLSNLEPSSAEVMKLIMFADLSEYIDRKNIIISPVLFAEILDRLKGETVTYNDNLYRVVMNETDARVCIDSEYKLLLKVSGVNKPQLIKCGDRFIVFDSERNEINQTHCSGRKNELISFAATNNGISIKPVFKSFTDKIYSRMYADIDVADELKEEFKLSELHIKAYFDMNEREISCRDELYIGESQTDEKHLKRDTDKERYEAFRNCLDNIGFEGNVLSDERDVLNFLRMDFAELKEYCDVYLSESIKNKTVTQFAPGTIRVEYESGIMNAFAVNSEYTDEELEEVLRAIRRNKRFILLKGDRLVTVDSEEAREFSEAVEDLGLDRKKLHKQKQVSMIQGLKAMAYSRSCEVTGYLKDMVKELAGFKELDIDIPQVNAELRPYQIEGFKWLKTISKYGIGGILADDMGLGKTLEMITLLADSDEKAPSLVVCPKSVVFNWKNEFARFLPQMEVTEVYGLASARAQTISKIDKKKKAVYITSYDSLRNDAECYGNIKFSHIILDEAQFIKNVEAQKSKNVKTLEAKHKFALTGTPIENNVIDLWSIFDFIMPGYLEELSTYKELYGNSKDNLDKLRRKVGPFILRRTKGDVLKDLPDKYERIVTAEMTKEQRKYYDAHIMRARQLMEENGKAFDILPYITRLRQICVHPATYDAAYTGGSGKMDQLCELLDTYLYGSAEEHKVLIFSQFVKGLNEVEKILKSRKIPYYMITGDTDAKDRIEMAEKFNTGSDVRVFLVSLKAGGTGLNLVGADVVIHLDPWWNAAAEDQATDRAHRIGQKRNVEVIKLVCEDTIEQRVIDLQNMKKDIIDKVISDDDSSVTGTTLEDLAFVLS